MQRILLRSLPALTASLSFGAAAAMPATAPEAVTAQLGPSATLIAKGAAVQVDVTYSCPSGSFDPSVSVNVTERVSAGRIAQGFGGQMGPGALNCDGSEHTLQLTVVASQSPGNAFRRGTAFVTGGLSTCDPFDGCTSTNFSGDIRIR